MGVLMLKGKCTLLVDQYGYNIYASTLKEVHEQVRGHISKMYREDKDGKTYHIGYVVGEHWFRAFKPVNIPVE